jgi:hypothetical protein
MGQKVNPVGFRLGINRTWDSKWFSEAGYAAWLKEQAATPQSDETTKATSEGAN